MGQAAVLTPTRHAAAEGGVCNGFGGWVTLTRVRAVTYSTMATIQEMLTESRKVYDLFASSKEHDQAIMTFTFFGFCVQIILLVSRCSRLLQSARRVPAPMRAGSQRVSRGGFTYDVGSAYEELIGFPPFAPCLRAASLPGAAPSVYRLQDRAPERVKETLSLYTAEGPQET